jgi:hypothetical protein
MPMRTKGLSLLVIAISVAILVLAALGQGAKRKPAQDTPEDAYRAFLLALAAQDEDALRELTLAADGFEWLLRGERIPRERMGESELGSKTLGLRRLHPGDTVTMAGGRVITILPEQVSERRAVLLAEGSPIPTDLRRVDGVWKVDATPIIAGRMAADAARRRAAEAKKNAQSQPKG